MTASFAIATKPTLNESLEPRPRDERAKSTVALVLFTRAVMPAPEPSGRGMEVAPALVTIGEEPVASQL